MKRLAALACIVALAGCGDGDATPERVVGLPTTTIDRVAELESQLDEVTARNVYLEGEIVKSNADQADLRRKVDAYIARASRSGTTARPVIATRRYSGGVEQWRAIISRYSWPVNTALAVMDCESGGNPNAYNATPVYMNGREYHARGLMQILDGPFDPVQNIALAFSMWSERGWQPWEQCI